MQCSSVIAVNQDGNWTCTFMSHDISSIGEESTPFSEERGELDFSLYCDKNKPRNGTDYYLLGQVHFHVITKWWLRDDKIQGHSGVFNAWVYSKDNYRAEWCILNKCNRCEVYERGNVVVDWVTVILITWQTDFHDWMTKINNRCMVISGVSLVHGSSLWEHCENNSL